MPVENLQISSARREKIELVFRRLAPALKTGQWIGDRNHYLRDTIKKTDGQSALKPGQLVQYIAASAPLHAIDSASYLGRSLYCSAINDRHGARHFAYYAELRAAMSILASEGIGVFNNVHWAVRDRSLLARTTPLGTHIYVWKALSDWAKTTQATELLSRVILWNGKRFDNSLLSAFPGTSLRPIASSWLSNWGMDLNLLSNDKIRRNQSSYRPRHFRKSLSDPKEIAGRIVSFWEVFAPTGSGGFESLDNHLTRIAFEMLAANIGLRKNTKRYIFAAQNLAVSGGGNVSPKSDFLMRRETASPRDNIVVASARIATRNTDFNEFPMLCRASLLLRLALGSSALLISDSGLNKIAVQDWFANYVVQCGLSSSLLAPSDYFNLWDEVSESLSNLHTSIPDFKNFSDIVNLASRDIVVLSMCERLAVWAIAS